MILSREGEYSGDDANACIIFKNGKNLRKACTATLVYLPQDYWYVEFYMHSALNLLAVWFSKNWGSISWTFGHEVINAQRTYECSSIMLLTAL